MYTIIVYNNEVENENTKKHCSVLGVDIQTAFYSQIERVFIVLYTFYCTTMFDRLVI